MHGRYCHGLRRLNDNSSASAGAKYSPVPSVLDNDNDHSGSLFLARYLLPSTPRPLVCRVFPWHSPRSYRPIPPPSTPPKILNKPPLGCPSLSHVLPPYDSHFYK